MPRTVVHQGSMAGILTPSQRVEDARWDAAAWGPNLTVVAGDLVAQKTADKLLYPYAAAGAGGLGVGVGISKFSFKTGADGRPIFGADTATLDYMHFSNLTAPFYYEGYFDMTELKIGGVAVAAFSDLTTAFGASGVKQHINGDVKLRA